MIFYSKVPYKRFEGVNDMKVTLVNTDESIGPKRPIEYVDSIERFELMCMQINNEKVIGLDVETTIYENPRRICTIQISTEKMNWVVDALKFNWIKGITNILQDPNIIKVIHNSSFEKSSFRNYGILISNIVDTLHISRRFRGMKIDGGHSLKVVCERELNILLDKSSQCSDWTRRPLTKTQILYGALDAEVLIELYRKFKEEFSDEALLA